MDFARLKQHDEDVNDLVERLVQHDPKIAHANMKKIWQATDDMNNGEITLALALFYALKIVKPTLGGLKNRGFASIAVGALVQLIVDFAMQEDEDDDEENGDG